MGKDVAAEKAREFEEEIRKFAEHLRQKVYARGYPEWGTLFSVIEELGVQIGDAVCREGASHKANQVPFRSTAGPTVSTRGV